MKSWLPWRFLVSRVARRHGFMDPFSVLARLRQFSQPSEVQEPIELIRAGVAFHARGLVNTKVLQNNLDWVWPYWATRQFDPVDPAFLPRAFSFTHVNLTHRNWTALGLPGMDAYPIVDPRGLVTPLLDKWSLDWWFIPADGSNPIFPSRALEATQRLHLDNGPTVATQLDSVGFQMKQTALVQASDSGPTAPTLQLTCAVSVPTGGWVGLAFRPANPEGISFIDTLEFDGQSTVKINGDTAVELPGVPTHWISSTYAQGDAANQITDAGTDLPALTAQTTHCPSGLATGVALFAINSSATAEFTAHLRVPARTTPSPSSPGELSSWAAALAPAPQFEAPEPTWQFLHHAALYTLNLLSPDEIYPGPYTYRRFWFRDACLILNALIAANETHRAHELLTTFPNRQKWDGYFHSQEGEWDANGQVLWISDRLERAEGKLLSPELWKSLVRGADWIDRKCVKAPDTAHHGLLPSGFSAEHLGPNDHYYWDDLWALAGLRSAVRMAKRRGDLVAVEKWSLQADNLKLALLKSFASLPKAVAAQGIPASPYRRMDSGAIGSMVADYPLQLDELGADQFTRTADWLTRHCLHHGGFFQDMIHSGVNAYLSLDLAQTLLRKNDSRYLGLVQAVADAASPTGQWPEAIHPHTGGGCMGDGQHAWAAAEWILMMRALFVREEEDHLAIGPGLPQSWFESTDAPPLVYGPTATTWGPVTVNLNRSSGSGVWVVSIDGHWHGQPPVLNIEIPGFKPVLGANSVTRLQRS